MAVKRSPFLEYFTDIWAGVATTYVGMKITLTHMFRPTVTMRYPETRPEIPKTHRGLHAYDEPKCIACRLCEKNCPVECIKIEMAGRGKDALITRYNVDYSKCLFCNLCAEVCPTHCVWLSQEFDAACGQRSQCVHSFARRKSDEDVAKHMAILAAKEAEKKAQQAAKAAEAAAEAAKAPVGPSGTPDPANKPEGDKS